MDHLGDKAGVIEAFFTFAQAEQQREAQELIVAESLNAEATKVLVGKKFTQSNF